MEIKVLGSGCKKCKKLEKIVYNLIDENNLDAKIEKVTKMKDIMS